MQWFLNMYAHSSPLYRLFICQKRFSMQCQRWPFGGALICSPFSCKKWNPVFFCCVTFKKWPQKSIIIIIIFFNVCPNFCCNTQSRKKKRNFTPVMNSMLSLSLWHLCKVLGTHEAVGFVLCNLISVSQLGLTGRRWASRIFCFSGKWAFNRD